MHELCPTGSRRVCYSVLQCACIAVPKGVTGGWPSPGWAAAEGREGAEGRSDREAGADERSDLSRVVREMHAKRLCCRLEWHGPQGSVGIALNIVTVPHFSSQSANHTHCTVQMLRVGLGSGAPVVWLRR